MLNLIRQTLNYYIMKKIFLTCLGLLLLSCSQDDNPTTFGLDKKTTTIDTGIDYRSPYNYNGYLENGHINYIFLNLTDFDFEVTPYFGLAYNTDPHGYYPPDYPYLNYNNQVYGNYLGATPIMVSAYDMIDYSSYDPVPTIHSYPNAANGYFDFPSDAASESGELLKRGKIFYIEFSVDGSPTIGKVKIPFPYEVNSQTGLSYPWKTFNYTDNVFGDELVYNEETREVCSTINPETSVRDFLKFTHNGEEYKVSSYMDENQIMFTLEPAY